MTCFVESIASAPNVCYSEYGDTMENIYFINIIDDIIEELEHTELLVYKLRNDNNFQN